MMRIITGKAKGIRLKTLEGNLTRPTAERVKEALFSMLQMDIEGRDVLDMFSGSGQLALEALSRGARQAVLIDRSPDAISVIRENAEKTRLISQCVIYRGDYLDYMRKNRTVKFDIVFIDPPYAEGCYTPALRALIDNQMLKPTSIIACESEYDNVIDDDYLRAHYSLIKCTRHGRAYLTLLSPIETEIKK